MSRSFKHFKNCPKHSVVIKDANCKFSKKCASRAVRLSKDIANGSSYKKHYESWNISDYRWLENNYSADEFRRKWFERDNELEWLWKRLGIRNWKAAYRIYLKRRMK